MNYEKAYKEALERAKEFQKSKDGLCVLTAESIFPELQESEDATWHDVAFYDEESHTFRHAKKPINVTKWVSVDELLEKQGRSLL